jgi:hypothetical protein
MSAVWIIVAKTRFPAELIESSKEGGVRRISLPFAISAEFIPDLLRHPDEELKRLTQGLPPEAPEFADIIHRNRQMREVIGQSLTVEQWYDGLLGRIGRQLQLEDEIEQCWLNHLRLSPLQRWMSAITEVVLPRYPKRLVIFVDSTQDRVDKDILRQYLTADVITKDDHDWLMAKLGRAEIQQQ